MYKPLSKIVDVDKDKCVSCHKCISVCPVKYCNIVVEDAITINEDLCIGCGQCIKHCTHDARIPIDDFDKAMSDLKRGVKMIAIAAPAVASNFPDYLKVNALLKDLGIEAVFDVSFGAELTVKSYMEYIKKNKPKALIAQPCPAIVSYIEIYKPELIKYLAPIDSPMLHIIKMVKEYYKEYKDHKVFVLSPCLAKRREFDHTGYGDYVVTIKSLHDYIEKNAINLSRYKDADFDNKPAERAVSFSTPGGLLTTVKREFSEAEDNTRKIEGPELIYDYLNELNTNINKGYAPLLIDCLNCEKGCNGGPGTLEHKNVDELESLIKKRKKEAMSQYKNYSNEYDVKSKKKIEKVLSSYWKEGLYQRKYTDMSDNLKKYIQFPDEAEIISIFQTMEKHSEADIKNCTTCGYNMCHNMAVAIFNKINIKDNCNHYLHIIVNREKEEKQLQYESIKKGTVDVFGQINKIAGNIESLSTHMTEQYAVIDGLVNSVKHMDRSIKDVEKITDSRKVEVTQLIGLTSEGSKKVKSSTSLASDISKRAEDIFQMISLIDDVTDRTNVLAINAAVESARAGTEGQRFSIIAKEIRNLASSTVLNTKNIYKSLSHTIEMMKESQKISGQSYDAFEMIVKSVKGVEELFAKILKDMTSLEDNSTQIVYSISQLSDIAKKVRDSVLDIETSSSNIKDLISEMI